MSSSRCKNEQIRQAFITKNAQFWADEAARLKLDYIKYIKYRLAAFTATWYDQVWQNLPPRPEGYEGKDSILLSGSYGRWVRVFHTRSQQCFETKFKFYEFLSTIGNGVKRGARRPDQDVVEQGVLKTQIHLFGAKSEDFKRANRGDQRRDRLGDLRQKAHPARRDVPDLDREFIRREVLRTVKEVFGEMKLTQDELVSSHHFPSLSATYEFKRAYGGTLGQLGANRVLSDTVRDIEEEGYPGMYISRPEAVEVNSVERLVCSHYLPPGNCQLCTSPDHFHVMPIFTHNSVTLDHTWTRYKQNLLARSTEYAPTEIGMVRLVGLSEALKVRVISAENGIRQFLLKPVQSFLWKGLKSHDAFRLVGETIDELSFGSLERLRLPSQFYVSGDYSDATNQFKTHLSEAVMDALFETCLSDMSDEYKNHFRGSLIGHFFEDPITGIISPQQTGQLMGSVISFPVLCLANAAIVRASCELGLPRGRLSLRKFLFNGDDCLFTTNYYGYHCWKIIGAFCGLSESVGKTFISREFIQMNSTNFLLVPEYDTWVKDSQGFFSLKSSVFRRTGFVNFGLLKGLGRSSISTEKTEGLGSKLTSVAQVETRMKELFLESPPHTHSVLRRVVREYQADFRALMLEKFPEIPLYLPQELGGVGLTPHDRWDFRHDLKASKALISRHVVFPDLKEPSEWAIHQKVRSLNPELFVKIPTNEIQDLHMQMHQTLYPKLLSSAFLFAGQVAEASVTDDYIHAYIDYFGGNKNFNAVRVFSSLNKLWKSTKTFKSYPALRPGEEPFNHTVNRMKEFALSPEIISGGAYLLGETLIQTEKYHHGVGGFSCLAGDVGLRMQIALEQFDQLQRNDDDRAGMDHHIGEVCPGSEENLLDLDTLFFL